MDDGKEKKECATQRVMRAFLDSRPTEPTILQDLLAQEAEYLLTQFALPLSKPEES